MLMCTMLKESMLISVAVKCFQICPPEVSWSDVSTI